MKIQLENRIIHLKLPKKASQSITTYEVIILAELQSSAAAYNLFLHRREEHRVDTQTHG